MLEEYGQRLHGYVVPPLTGLYTFWIASDDSGALYLKMLGFQRDLADARIAHVRMRPQAHKLAGIK